MATFISYKAFNFNSIQEAGSSSADPNATDTQYQLSGSTVSCTVSGSGFTYDQTSKVLSGTITDFSATTSGSEYYSVFDLNADAAASSTAYSQGYTMGSTTLSGAKGELALWLAGDDAVDGSDSSDYLFSGAGNDSVNGGTGNDTLWGGLGNDTLDGGTGTNKAVFSGKSSAYALSAHADGTITISGTDGTDTLTNIQSLTFDDKNISVMKALPLAHLEGLPYYAKIQSYFIAMADRPATDDELA
ncbi:MAG TPA: hypothetical protein VK187_13275, partial [Geobacteraceae bacterium]|nr:hypothetical protein [Geobacteraceae bacterium]